MRIRKPSDITEVHPGDAAAWVCGGPARIEFIGSAGAASAALRALEVCAYDELPFTVEVSVDRAGGGDIRAEALSVRLFTATPVALARHWLSERVAQPRAESQNAATIDALRHPDENRFAVPRSPRAESPLVEFLRAMLAPPLTQIIPDQLELPGVLAKYQKEGVVFLYSRSGAILADEMGLGKTIQAVVAMRLLVSRDLFGSSPRVLILGPRAVLGQWRDEIAKWAPGLSRYVLTVAGDKRKRRKLWSVQGVPAICLASYETFRADFDAADKAAAPALHDPWHLVVCDEAQKVKNPETEVSREVKLLQRHRSWAVTGTPLENSPDDMASILAFARQDLIVTPGNLQEMVRQFHATMLRRRIGEVDVELPPKIIQDVLIDLDDAQRSEYSGSYTTAQAELLGLVGNEQRFRFAAKDRVFKLMRICNSASIAPYASAKLDYLTDQLEEVVANDGRALVFSQWTQTPFGTDRIDQHLRLKHPDWGICVYRGDLSDRERQRVIEEFQSSPDARVLIVSLRAGGTGLNLQRASHVFHFDRWWNPAVEAQAEGRAHRRGQERAVTVHRYIARNTIEEQIALRLAEKQQLFDDLVNSRDGDVELAISNALSTADYMALFELGASPDIKPGDAEWEGFEALCEVALGNEGYQVSRTPRSGDEGIDVIGTQENPNRLALLQAKAYGKPVGPEVVRAFIGALAAYPARADRAILASKRGFTAGARSAADNAPGVSIELWDGEEADRRSRLARRP